MKSLKPVGVITDLYLKWSILLWCTVLINHPRAQWPSETWVLLLQAWINTTCKGMVFSADIPALKSSQYSHRNIFTIHKKQLKIICRYTLHNSHNFLSQSMQSQGKKVLATSHNLIQTKEYRHSLCTGLFSNY